MASPAISQAFNYSLDEPEVQPNNDIMFRPTTTKATDTDVCGWRCVYTLDYGHNYIPIVPSQPLVESTLGLEPSEKRKGGSRPPFQIHRETENRLLQRANNGGLRAEEALFGKNKYRTRNLIFYVQPTARKTDKKRGCLMRIAACRRFGFEVVKNTVVNAGYTLRGIMDQEYQKRIEEDVRAGCYGDLAWTAPAQGKKKDKMVRWADEQGGSLVLPSPRRFLSAMPRVMKAKPVCEGRVDAGVKRTRAEDDSEDEEDPELRAPPTKRPFFGVSGRHQKQEEWDSDLCSSDDDEEVRKKAAGMDEVPTDTE